MLITVGTGLAPVRAEARPVPTVWRQGDNQAHETKTFQYIQETSTATFLVLKHGHDSIMRDQCCADRLDGHTLSQAGRSGSTHPPAIAADQSAAILITAAKSRPGRAT